MARKDEEREFLGVEFGRRGMQGSRPCVVNDYVVERVDAQGQNRVFW